MRDEEPRLITMDDVLADPHSFGMPTFEEYKMMRSKYVGKPDDLLAAVDAGGTILKAGNYFQKIRYRYKIWACDTPEELQKIVENEGIRLDELEMMPTVIPETSYSSIVDVEFMTKQEFSRRREIAKQARCFKG